MPGAPNGGSAEAGTGVPHAVAPADLPRPPGVRLRLRPVTITPLAVVLIFTALGVLFNWLQKYPCHSGNYGEGRALRFACYTDVLALYSNERLHEGAIPYFGHPVEYPVLTGLAMGIIGLPVNAAHDSGFTTSLFGAFGLGNPGDGTIFYDLTSILLAVFALLTTWAVVRSRPHRPYDALMIAVAPGVLLAATVNWDFLAVGLTACAILAWARRSPGWAGILFGLAAAAKFFPLLILGPLLILCLRKGGPAVRAGLTTIGMAAATWLAVNVPLAIAANEGWSRFYRFSSERGVDWGTFWWIGDHIPLNESPLDRWFASMVYDVDRLNLTAWVLFALCCGGIAALIWYAPRRPRFAAMAFLVVAAFLLTNKVWSQQFVLWLIPLAVLARPKWGVFLVWQATEVAYFLSFYQVQLRGGEAEFALLQAATFRWIGVALMCGFVVWEALHPEADVVRANGVDDPEGGVLVDLEPQPPPAGSELGPEPVTDPEPNESNADERPAPVSV